MGSIKDKFIATTPQKPTVGSSDGKEFFAVVIDIMPYEGKGKHRSCANPFGKYTDAILSIQSALDSLDKGNCETRAVEISQDGKTANLIYSLSPREVEAVKKIANVISVKAEPEYFPLGALIHYHPSRDDFRLGYISHTSKTGPKNLNRSRPSPG